MSALTITQSARHCPDGATQRVSVMRWRSGEGPRGKLAGSDYGWDLARMTQIHAALMS